MKTALGRAVGLGDDGGWAAAVAVGADAGADVGADVCVGGVDGVAGAGIAAVSVGAGSGVVATLRKGTEGTAVVAG